MIAEKVAIISYLAAHVDDNLSNTYPIPKELD